MYERFKKIIFRLLGFKHWRNGKCNNCGECCKTITLRFSGKLLTRESEFEYLQKKIKRYQHFTIFGKADNGVLLFKCNYLDENNRCSVYHLRSFLCRTYPHFDNKFIKLGGKPLPGCGYYYEPIVHFDEVLKKTKKVASMKRADNNRKLVHNSKEFVYK